MSVRGLPPSANCELRFAALTPRVESSEDGRPSRWRGCVGARRRLTPVPGSASAEGLDLRAARVSVAAFDFGPDSCVLELASSDELADSVGDQLPRP
jgi:hypothetical protein